MYLIGYQDDSTALALGTIIEVGGRKKMTNREWLAGMTDRELGKWLDEHIDACCVCSHKKGHSCNIPDNGYDCENGRYEWLGMKHKGDGNGK